MCQYCQLTLNTKAFSQGMERAIRQVSAFKREAMEMPNSPPTCCPCGGKRINGKCDRCGPKKRAPEQRKNFRERGYGTDWDKARAVFISYQPLCAECKRNGLVVAGYAVDHIIPHRGDMEIFWDQDNWQTLCRSCHARKSASERKATGGV